MALLLSFQLPPVNWDPHPGTGKEVGMEMCVFRSPAVYASVPPQPLNEVMVT